MRKKYLGIREAEADHNMCDASREPEPQSGSDGSQTGHGPSPLAVFTTDALPPQDRFIVWRDSISVLFDVHLPAGEQDAADFRASLSTRQFGSMLLAETSATGQVFNRDERRINTDGIGHFLIQLYCSGSALARFSDTGYRIVAGDVMLIDTAQPSSFVCDDFRNLTLVVPRPLLEKRIPGAERLHGRVLPRDHVAAQLLGGNLRLMQELAAGHDPVALQPVGEAMLDLVARCLSMAEPSGPEAGPELKVATLIAVKRFLEARLNDPHLGPDSVLGAFRMSRAYLYELFAPHGGVARYILQRRLTRSLAALRVPANRHRKVADIAFAHGFSSESHFSRAFRKAFGMTPRDARTAPPDAIAPPDGDSPTDRRYEAWLRTIG